MNSAKRVSAVGRRSRLAGVTAAFVAVLMAVAATACNSAGCTDNRSSVPEAGFYSSATRQQIALDSIEIHGVGAPGDSLLSTVGRRISQIALPLRSNASVTRFCIAYRYEALDYPQLNDTLTFDYTAIPYFASEECGAMMRYRIHSLTFTRHLLDSVSITAADSLITNTPGENIRLFFRTQ